MFLEQEYQLTFEEGDRIHILEKSNDVWWWAELEGTVGYIPASYVMDINDVRTKQNEEEEDKYQSEEYFGGYSALVSIDIILIAEIHKRLMYLRMINITQLNLLTL